jgi:hypothetical protein
LFEDGAVVGCRQPGVPQRVEAHPYTGGRKAVYGYNANELTTLNGSGKGWSYDGGGDETAANSPLGARSGETWTPAEGVGNAIGGVEGDLLSAGSTAADVVGADVMILSSIF